uniref:Putative tail tubular protein n=1 Tax=viral metagenome TaxID=1070528 RepID=A0A6M3XLM8_9ZZZZ
MAVSKTSLVNKALTLAGATPITNITDDTNNARIVNRVYEISLKSILGECKWNFATQRVLLVSSATTMAWYYTNETTVYVRPSACIRIFGTNDDDAEWREEGDLIISDTTGLGIIYTYYLDDPSKYPSSFVEAFIDKLCSDIGYMIINDKQAGAAFLEKYNKISLTKAMAENAQIGKHQYLKDDAWELAKTQNTSPSA